MAADGEPAGAPPRRGAGGDGVAPGDVIGDVGGRYAGPAPAVLRPAAAVLGVSWLAYLGMLQWSVVRFRVAILLTLTTCALLLAWWLVRHIRVEVPPRVAALVLVAAAAFPWAVPLFSYLRGGWASAASVTVSATALVGAGLLWWGTRTAAGTRAATAHASAFAAAVVGHLVLATVALVGDRAPRIDVFVVLQQATGALGRGENFYDLTWSGSPGVTDIFPYLPWTAVLLAPGRWLTGDVRWSLAGWSLVLLAGVWFLARSGRVPGERAGTALRAAVPAAWLVTAPGGITQVDQAWTEPLLAAAVVWWAVLVRRGHAWWAVVPLALACASKQHLAVVLPLLLLWRPFGWRRAIATGAAAAALIAPWVVASPAAFLDDTVVSLVRFHAIRFANTWYLFFLNEFGIELPFAVTGVVVLGTLGLAMWTVHRRQPRIDELLRWFALVLLAANLVNKQAFYNQFWLSAALVACSLAVAPRRADRDPAAPPGRADLGLH